MTPGVNLLPARYVERIAERRRVVVTAAALLVLLAGIALAAGAQGREVRQAEKKRDGERTRTAELQARRAKLASFRPLADGIVGRERLLAAAMGTEVSWAAILTSLSSTFPAHASLTSLTAESTLNAFGGPAVARDDRGTVIGFTTLSGYSVEEFTPGVRQTLELLDTVTGLAEPRLDVGTAEKIGERPVTTFDGNTFVDGAALTGRYADGLPPEDDVEVPRIGGTTPAGATPPAGTGTSK